MTDAVGRHRQAIFEKAIPQLISTTCHRMALGKRNCPYQAKVMKMLETNRSARWVRVRSWAVLVAISWTENRASGSLPESELLTH